MLTVRLLLIFMHLLCVHLATLKIHSVFQTPQNFEQRTSPEIVNNSGNEATSLVRILFLLSICIIWDASMEHLLTRCYQAVWGCAVRKKERAVTGSLGQSGLTHSLHVHAAAQPSILLLLHEFINFTCKTGQDIPDENFSKVTSQHTIHIFFCVGQLKSKSPNLPVPYSLMAHEQSQ